MMWKKELLKKSGLYLVTDREVLKQRDIIKIMGSSLEAGLDMIQLRDKYASDKEFLELGFKVKGLLKGKKAILIINDRVDLALALDADGVHLGEEDIPVKTARKILGRKKIIGFSTHSVRETQEASGLDVDYISIGAVFPTPIKPDYNVVGIESIKKLAKEIKIPLIAIGGIDETNITTVVNAGIKRIAVIRSIICAKDPFLATKKMLLTLSTS